MNGYENWAVKKRKAAERQLASLPKELRQEANSILDELAEDGPAIFGAIELRHCHEITCPTLPRGRGSE